MGARQDGVIAIEVKYYNIFSILTYLGLPKLLVPMYASIQNSEISLQFVDIILKSAIGEFEVGFLSY